MEPLQIQERCGNQPCTASEGYQHYAGHNEEEQIDSKESIGAKALTIERQSRVGRDDVMVSKQPHIQEQQRGKEARIGNREGAYSKSRREGRQQQRGVEPSTPDVGRCPGGLWRRL